MAGYLRLSKLRTGGSSSYLQKECLEIFVNYWFWRLGSRWELLPKNLIGGFLFPIWDSGNRGKVKEGGLSIFLWILMRV